MSGTQKALKKKAVEWMTNEWMEEWMPGQTGSTHEGSTGLGGIVDTRIMLMALR